MSPIPLLLGWLVLSACTDDTSGAADEGDETGYGEPSPEDPLDGEGSNPPGDPDTNATWAPAQALGNGLVHDSRYDLEAGKRSRDFTGTDLNSGVDWAGFVTEHAAKVTVGFRPVQVDGFYELVPLDKNKYELSVTDRSVYLSDDDANYKTETKTYLFRNLDDERNYIPSYGSGRGGGPRPTAIDTFSIDGDTPPVGTTIVWTYDGKPIPWRLVVGEPQAQFEETVENLRGQGYRPVSLASRHRLGQLEYAAIFIADGTPGDDWRVTLGAHWSNQAQDFDNWEDGFYPSMQSFADRSPNSVGRNYIWTRTPPGLKVEVRQNLDEALFEELDADFRKQGYNLQSATRYNISIDKRYAGIWVQYEPYLRWQGTKYLEADTNYQSRYKPFHDQVIETMTVKGLPKEGEYYRPSATLHIFEGENLVLSRAYTYAPAIYPDTPENAAFPLASVSKSLTATALVREMAIQGLDIDTTDFWQVIGATPPSDDVVPSVADVLQNKGGFNKDNGGYSNHNTIRESGYGDFPITGDEYLDFVKGLGLLWTGDGEKIWNQALYGMFVYSNIGYTLLGEAVRTLSGEYETYVRDNLLAPAGAIGQIYPDRGHRFLRDDDQVTSSALRGYLSNEGHAYRMPTQDQTEPTPPIFGSGPTPEPGGTFKDGFITWSPNTAVDHDWAPTTASKLRHAGQWAIGGAPLAAGGWVGRGTELGRLIRAIAQSETVLPETEAQKLWSLDYANVFGGATGWRYGLGWYMRGDWIAMAGGSGGASTLVLHNRWYDFTVVYLTNMLGQPIGDFINPLLESPDEIWGQSKLGGVFPCHSVGDTQPDPNPCTNAFATPY